MKVRIRASEVYGGGGCQQRRCSQGRESSSVSREAITEISLSWDVLIALEACDENIQS